MTLIHVTTPSGWAAIQAEGRLEAHPFVHLCTDEQLAFVLERHFPASAHVTLVRLDTNGLDIRWEHSEPGMDPFPHLYGPAPLSAVTGTEAV